MKNRVNVQNRRVFWSKEERRTRQAEMEEFHPGYLDMQFKLHVMLGIVFFVRGFYHAFSIMIGQENLSYVIIVPISLLIGFYMYLYCMETRGLAILFFVFRVIELGRSLWSTAPYVFYFNFIGTVWWVVLVLCLLLDVMFLGYLIFSKKGRQQLSDNQTISSGKIINLRKATAESVGMDDGLMDGPMADGQEESAQQDETQQNETQQDDTQ